MQAKTETPMSDEQRQDWIMQARDAHDRVKNGDPSTPEGRAEMVTALGFMHAVEVITRPQSVTDQDIFS